MVLIRKTGFACSSNPYGITDPNGKPRCLRESVERLPTRPRYTNVRARSAKVGSAIAGCPAPEPACFPVVDEDILCSPVVDSIPWNKLTRRGLTCLLEGNVPSTPALPEIMNHGRLGR